MSPLTTLLSHITSTSSSCHLLPVTGPTYQPSDMTLGPVTCSHKRAKLDKNNVCNALASSQGSNIQVLSKRFKILVHKIYIICFMQYISTSSLFSFFFFRYNHIVSISSSTLQAPIFQNFASIGNFALAIQIIGEKGFNNEDPSAIKGKNKCHYSDDIVSIFFL